ncbi:phosphonate C-P lyase system protein PhnG [Pseudochelatococcus sp. B33]
MIENENDRPSIAAGVAARQRIMALCADASAADLGAALTALGPLPPVVDLRPPDAGLLMVQGRMGGDGGPFNIGEATVARAAVQVGGAATGDAALGEAATGFAWHLGRDLAKARLAAVIDALWQDETRRASVEAALSPIARRIAERAAQRAAETASTRVNFFTMVRGDD